ncbi:hypothetical protein PSTG_03117 [Puccinia striiformis f. sp. tritici PST-78]|uniref:Uncharacterized protein n=1 Tax=Puccinia striiformis f. sp. tritici PST-78 TaxID=1165861 RepID=A0A0L0VWA5_9BASI|nr:hypothetical protein PSTG_03117 [Puccinia striiformis f. sp. tritici PST-78]
MHNNLKFAWNQSYTVKTKAVRTANRSLMEFLPDVDDRSEPKGCERDLGLRVGSPCLHLAFQSCLQVNARGVEPVSKGGSGKHLSRAAVQTAQRALHGTPTSRGAKYK